MNNSSTGLPENVAGALCYALGFLSGLIFLIFERRSLFVRFHAMQSLMAFGIIALAGIAVQILPGIGAALSFVLNVFALALWIVCMVQAWQGRRWKLPLVGEEAEKQANRMVL
ncbi:hypothetical protein GF314_09135 [bacterium]|nr:hypothetical protein [bacterium]